MKVGIVCRVEVFNVFAVYTYVWRMIRFWGDYFLLHSCTRYTSPLWAGYIKAGVVEGDCLFKLMFGK